MHPENPLNAELVDETFHLAIATTIITSVAGFAIAVAMVTLFHGSLGWTYVLLAAATLLFFELLRRGHAMSRTEALHRRFEPAGGTGTS